MVVFAFQYVALNALAHIGAILRWLATGGRVPLRVIKKDLYFNASIPAFVGTFLALVLEFGFK